MVIGFYNPLKEGEDVGLLESGVFGSPLWLDPSAFEKQSLLLCVLCQSPLKLLL